MELSKEKQELFQTIADEYRKVYQEIKDGTLTEILIRENKTKQVFALSNGNWGLSTGTLRKKGRQGDILPLFIG